MDIYWYQEGTCSIKLDEDRPLFWIFPEGKTKTDLIRELCLFFDKITTDNVESHSKSRIQDENVRYGLARCDNELKEKSVRKFREHVQSDGGIYAQYVEDVDNKICIRIEDDPAINFIYPDGKTRAHLLEKLYSFFNQ